MQGRAARTSCCKVTEAAWRSPEQRSSARRSPVTVSGFSIRRLPSNNAVSSRMCTQYMRPHAPRPRLALLGLAWRGKSATTAAAAPQAAGPSIQPSWVQVLLPAALYITSCNARAGCRHPWLPSASKSPCPCLRTIPSCLTTYAPRASTPFPYPMPPPPAGMRSINNNMRVLQQ